MCLALLGNVYTPVSVIEQIILSRKDGKLCTRIVYDVFFEARQNCEKTYLLAISPHDLFSEEKTLLAEVKYVPGTEGDDDFYARSIQAESEYNPDTNSFSVKIPGDGGYKPSIHTLAGTVIRPTLSFPFNLDSHPEVLDIMRECGTMFRIDIGKLERGKSYAMRLVIKPSCLLGINPPRELSDPEFDEVSDHWAQELTITCPRTCRLNYKEMLVECARTSTYSEASSLIQQTISLNDNFLLPIKKHVIVLIALHKDKIITGEDRGCIWQVAPYILDDGRPAIVWASGTDEYWNDDPEPLAHRIYSYLSKYGEVELKTKEDISTALNTSHDNCSLIVDVMCDKGALVKVDNVHYKIISKDNEAILEIMRIVAASDKVRNNFKWQGFQVRYSIEYKYASETKKRRFRRKRKMRDMAFWLAVISILIGLASLLLCLFNRPASSQPAASMQDKGIENSKFNDCNEPISTE